MMWCGQVNMEQNQRGKFQHLVEFMTQNIKNFYNIYKLYTISTLSLNFFLDMDIISRQKKFASSSEVSFSHVNLWLSEREWLLKVAGWHMIMLLEEKLREKSVFDQAQKYFERDFRKAYPRMPPLRCTQSSLQHYLLSPANRFLFLLLYNGALDILVTIRQNSITYVYSITAIAV